MAVGPRADLTAFVRLSSPSVFRLRSSSITFLSRARASFDSFRFSFRISLACYASSDMESAMFCGCFLRKTGLSAGVAVRSATPRALPSLAASEAFSAGKVLFEPLF